MLYRMQKEGRGAYLVLRSMTVLIPYSSLSVFLSLSVPSSGRAERYKRPSFTSLGDRLACLQLEDPKDASHTSFPGTC